MANIKKDLIFGAICGELSALFLLSVIKNPYVEEFEALASLGVLLWALLLILPLGFSLGILAAEFFSRFVKIFPQVAKFLEIGVLNTLIDMGILNILIWLTGITAGVFLAPLNTISFTLAVANSYFWNKSWTFSGTAGGKKFFQFLIVSAIGWGINTGIVVLGTTFLAPSLSVSAGGLVNIMKLSAIVLSMTWNFIGYKFLVFNKQS